MVLNVLTIGMKLLAAFTMFSFGRPKLLGLPVSVKSFTQFGEVLNIDGRAFMHFTGGLEMFTALLLFVSIFTDSMKWGNSISIAAWILLLGTMFGALFTEYKIRPEPVGFLVQIAIIMIGCAVPQLYFLLRNFSMVKS